MSNVEPHANTPNVRTAYKAVVIYIEKNEKEFTDVQLEAAKELKHRIRRLENDCNRLIKINNILLDEKVPKLQFDETTGTMTVSHKGGTQSIIINRANLNVPVKLKGSSTIGAYKAGEGNEATSTDSVEELKMELEQKVEHFYNNAFRITKLIQDITGKKKYHCSEITIVRNKLIEHPDKGSIYSFGFSSNGPVVKPMFKGHKEWNDNGLVPNTVAFVKSLEEVFSMNVDQN